MNSKKTALWPIIFFNYVVNRMIVHIEHIFLHRFACYMIRNTSTLHHLSTAIVAICSISLVAEARPVVHHYNHVWVEEHRDATLAEAIGDVIGLGISCFLLWKEERNYERFIDTLVEDLHPECVTHPGTEYSHRDLEFDSVLSPQQYQDIYAYIHDGSAWQLVHTIPKEAYEIKRQNIRAERKEAPLRQLQTKKLYAQECQRRINENQRSFMERTERLGQSALQAHHELTYLDTVASSIDTTHVMCEWGKIIGICVSIMLIMMVCGYLIARSVGLFTGGIIGLAVIVLLGYCCDMKYIQSDHVVAFNELSDELARYEHFREFSRFAIPHALYPPHMRDDALAAMRTYNQYVILRKRIQDEIISLNYNRCPERLDYFVNKFAMEIDHRNASDVAPCVQYS